MDEIQAIFFEECAEGLTAAEAGLSAMAEGDTGSETIAGVFRAVHSIKGGSGAFGHVALLGFSHRFENLLDEVRAGRIAPTASLVKQLLGAFDVLSDHVTAARDGGSPPADAAMMAELDRLLENGGAAAPSEATPPEAPAVGDEFGFSPVAVELTELDEDPFGFAPVAVALEDLDGPVDAALDLTLPFADEPGPPWTVDFRPSRAALANGAEPLLVVRELERLGGVVVGIDRSRLPGLREIEPGEGYLGWTLELPGSIDESELRDCFDFVAPDSLIQVARIRPAQPRAATASPVRETSLPGVPEDRPAVVREPMNVRVDLARLDHLLNLIGELVIRNSVLADRLSSVDQDKVELPQLLRLTRQIQDSVMGLRAQPIKQAFSRVPRLLRDLSAETGKAIELIVTGENTEVDKRVIERIGDPLTHMIRNAVDHGIEPAAARRAAGKPETGTIRLSAEQKGGRIIVRVADDGGGIDRARVRSKAVERGIVAAETALTNEEIDQLICAPGFSTAETISNISGRGVGMDVVRSNIEQLGGRVEIASVPGEGTSFTMILPLTLAILDGMIVRLGGRRYVLPLGGVVESVQPEPGQIQQLSPGREVIELRGAFLPMRRLHRFFNLRGLEPPPEESLVIVVESDGAGLVGLMVDTIEDRREVVIKSLDQNLYPIRGLGGATVLGDGSIALILDIDAIVATAPVTRATKGLAA